MAEWNKNDGKRPDREPRTAEEKEPGRTFFENTGGAAKREAGSAKKDGKFMDLRSGWRKIREHLGMDKLFLILLAGVLLLFSSFPFGKETKKGGIGGQQAENISDDGSAGSGNFEADADGGQIQSGTAGYAAWLEKRLEAVLLSVDGVGEVKVMITLKNNGEKQLQSDTVRERSNTSETDSAGGSRNVQEGREEYSTVILNDGSGDSPYVTRETAPEIEGVLVVAQGAGSASVKTEIYEAVQVLFNIPVHKIKVLKGVLEN